MRTLVAAPIIVFLLALPTTVVAKDVGVAGRRLVVIDGGPSGNSKVVYIAKGAEVDKGNASDIGGISAHLEISRGDAIGAFTVPAGAFAASGDGWRENAATKARYLNRSASTGTPTGVRSLVLKQSKSLRVVARSLGDAPLDFSLLAGSPAGVRVVATIANGEDLHRHCTTFAASDLKVSGPSASGRSKLVASNGVAAPCPGLVLSPTPPLSPAPAAPHLYFDGADAGAIAALQAKIGDPATSGYFGSFRAVVDGGLASLAGANDDQRARVAKAAGLLHVLGETPPGGSGFATYAEVAVTALLGLMDRTALDSVDEFINPPPNLLHVLQDSGRLQSIAEAYDFLRGASIDPADDLAIRDLIATWADAYVEDWNLIGDPFGLFAGHRNNWAIKGGSALVTVALALPAHASAPTWLASGMLYLNESLYEVVKSPGWYSESPHYVSYSLNNLVSTAWHVRNAANTEWFDDLAPLVDTALALRQPDGESAPFEEGVANAFPHDVLAAAYPSRAARMLWAWQESSQDPVSYDNQQIHSVTRFLVVDTTSAAAAPGVPATVFLDGDVHAAVLRSGWDSAATQLTSMTALDHSDSEQFESRHNMENPLDLTFHAAGAMLLPTSSGGPQVTSSANRTVYLEPSSKNIPLVDGDAPYLLDPTGVVFGERLDSADAGGAAHSLLDSATTSVSEFAAGVDVQRTVALVANRFGVVVDVFASDSVHDYGAAWRGRGDSSVRILDPAHAGVDYAWPTAGTATAHLSIDVAGSTALNGTVDTGLYAPAWGVEEVLSPLRCSATGTTEHFLTVLRPRVASDPVAAITAIGSGTVAAFLIAGGATELVIASAGGSALAADGVSSDALLAVAQRDSGSTTGLAMVRGAFVDDGARIETDRPATLAATVDSGTAVIAVSGDTSSRLRITLAGWVGLDEGASHAATLDGVPLLGGSFTQAGDTFRVRVPNGGTVVIYPSP